MWYVTATLHGKNLHQMHPLEEVYTRFKES